MKKRGNVQGGDDEAQLIDETDGPQRDEEVVAKYEVGRYDRVSGVGVEARYQKSKNGYDDMVSMESFSSATDQPHRAHSLNSDLPSAEDSDDLPLLTPHVGRNDEANVAHSRQQSSDERLEREAPAYPSKESSSSRSLCVSAAMEQIRTVKIRAAYVDSGIGETDSARGGSTGSVVCVDVKYHDSGAALGETITAETDTCDETVVKTSEFDQALEACEGGAELKIGGAEIAMTNVAQVINRDVESDFYGHLVTVKPQYHSSSIEECCSDMFGRQVEINVRMSAPSLPSVTEKAVCSVAGDSECDSIRVYELSDLVQPIGESAYDESLIAVEGSIDEEGIRSVMSTSLELSIDTDNSTMPLGILSREASWITDEGSKNPVLLSTQQTSPCLVSLTSPLLQRSEDLTPTHMTPHPHDHSKSGSLSSQDMRSNPHDQMLSEPNGSKTDQESRSETGAERTTRKGQTPPRWWKKHGNVISDRERGKKGDLSWEELENNSIFLEFLLHLYIKRRLRYENVQAAISSVERKLSHIFQNGPRSLSAERFTSRVEGEFTDWSDALQSSSSDEPPAAVQTWTSPRQNPLPPGPSLTLNLGLLSPCQSSMSVHRRGSAEVMGDADDSCSHLMDVNLSESECLAPCSGLSSAGGAQNGFVNALLRTLTLPPSVAEVIAQSKWEQLTGGEVDFVRAQLIDLDSNLLQLFEMQISAALHKKRAVETLADGRAAANVDRLIRSQSQMQHAHTLEIEVMDEGDIGRDEEGAAHEAHMRSISPGEVKELAAETDKRSEADIHDITYTPVVKEPDAEPDFTMSVNIQTQALITVADAALIGRTEAVTGVMSVGAKTTGGDSPDYAQCPFVANYNIRGRFASEDVMPDGGSFSIEKIAHVDDFARVDGAGSVGDNLRVELVSEKPVFVEEVTSSEKLVSAGEVVLSGANIPVDEVASLGEIDSLPEDDLNVQVYGFSCSPTTTERSETGVVEELSGASAPGLSDQRQTSELFEHEAVEPENTLAHPPDQVDIRGDSAPQSDQASSLLGTNLIAGPKEIQPEVETGGGEARPATEGEAGRDIQMAETKEVESGLYAHSDFESESADMEKNDDEHDAPKDQLIGNRSSDKFSEGIRVEDTDSAFDCVEPSENEEQQRLPSLLSSQEVADKSGRPDHSSLSSTLEEIGDGSENGDITRSGPPPASHLPDVVKMMHESDASGSGMVVHDGPESGVQSFDVMQMEIEPLAIEHERPSVADQYDDLTQEFDSSSVGHSARAPVKCLSIGKRGLGVPHTAQYRSPTEHPACSEHNTTLDSAALVSGAMEALTTELLNAATREAVDAVVAEKGVAFAIPKIEIPSESKDEYINRNELSSPESRLFTPDLSVNDLDTEASVSISPGADLSEIDLVRHPSNSSGGGGSKSVKTNVFGKLGQFFGGGRKHKGEVSLDSERDTKKDTPEEAVQKTKKVQSGFFGRRKPAKD